MHYRNIQEQYINLQKHSFGVLHMFNNFVPSL